MSDASKFSVEALKKGLTDWLNKAKGGDGATSGSTAPAAGASPARKDVKQRWLLIAGVAGLAVVLVASMASDGQRTKTRTGKKELEAKMVDVTPKELDRRSWQAQSMVEMEKLRRDLDRVNQTNEQILKELSRVKERAESAERSKEAARGDARLNGVTPPPVPKNRAGGGDAPIVPGVPSAGAGAALVPPQPPGIGAEPGASLPQVGTGAEVSPPSITTVPMGPPLVSKPPAPAKPTSSDPAAAAANAETKASVQVKESPYAGMLPPGAFADVALLHGLDAATGTTAQANPQPVLLNIQNHATLPGAARYQLKSCFALGSAFGDLSSERLYVQLAKLSCVDKQNRLMLATEIQGYIVDSDGRLGLRGEVVDRQGAKLAKSMLAGFAEGLAGALKMSQGSVSSSPLGSITSMAGEEAVRSAGLQGVSTGASQLSQFYLKEASQMFPVISVDAGRKANIVIQSGANLKWGPQDALYEKRITPGAK